jgi:flagella basal body P-ring formation protein FlgA
MRFAVLAFSLLVPACLLADPASAVIERLIADAWAPQTVRVEWTFNEKTPAILAQHANWRLAEPYPARFAGSIIVTLERRDERGSLQRMAVSGTARIFGSVVTVLRKVEAGQPLDNVNISHVEAEWTRLNGVPVSSMVVSSPMVAARALLPGRAVLEQDVKAAPLIRRGQTVALLVSDGSVHVRLNGRALEDGAVGERISVAADIGKSKSFSGTVAADGTVLLIR